MNAKKIIVLAGVAVLAYCLIVYPVQLANRAQTAFGWFTTGADSAITFVQGVRRTSLSRIEEGSTMTGPSHLAGICR